ncbi:S-layer homology domain-containing protein [Halocella sp. SP3-1]|uniref:S-layer homology domain-containing protein n=1 Tax=Halocella sp. SP3-1 TaxID=2382161 RepID=UPI000F759A82|nr:S-layer homology domain-containing protein [Halocella sp. SP3-1]AZO95462.1 hypothetical protein D7D81_13140 [Halocella sp. SP3-1]
MKRIIVLMMVFILLISCFVRADGFKDVPTDHWAYQSVKKLVDAGLLSLHEDGTFRGQDKVSRYQLAEILARILEGINDAGTQVNKNDMNLIRKLSVEFQEELVDLAVRGDAFQEQIEELQKKDMIQDEFMTEIKDIDIASLNNSVKKVDTRVSNVEDDVSRIIENIIKIKTLEEELQDLRAKVVELEEDMNERLSLLEDMKLQSTNETIEQLKDNISVNQARINSLQREVNSLKGEVNDKNSEIKELESKKNNSEKAIYAIGGIALLLLLLGN